MSSVANPGLLFIMLTRLRRAVCQPIALAIKARPWLIDLFHHFKDEVSPPSTPPSVCSTPAPSAELIPCPTRSQFCSDEIFCVWITGSVLVDSSLFFFFFRDLCVCIRDGCYFCLLESSTDESHASGSVQEFERENAPYDSTL